MTEAVTIWAIVGFTTIVVALIIAIGNILFERAKAENTALRQNLEAAQAEIRRMTIEHHNRRDR